MQTITEVFAAIAYLHRIVATLEMGSNNLEHALAEYRLYSAEIEDYLEKPDVLHSLDESFRIVEQLECLEERFSKWLNPILH